MNHIVHDNPTGANLNMRDYANRLLAGPSRPGHDLSPTTTGVRVPTKRNHAQADPRTVIWDAIGGYGTDFKSPDAKLLNDVLDSCGVDLLVFLFGTSHGHDDNAKARAWEAMQDAVILHAERSQYWGDVVNPQEPTKPLNGKEIERADAKNHR